MKIFQKRAEKEIGIVAGCRDTQQQKIEFIEKEVAVLSAEIGVLEEKICATEDKSILHKLAQAHKKAQRQLAKKSELLDLMMDIYDGLDDLCELLRDYYRREQYVFIIRTIPERKLPKMINDMNQVYLLYNLIVELEIKFNADAELGAIVRNKHRKQTDDEDKDHGDVMDRYNREREEEEEEWIRNVKNNAQNSQATNRTKRTNRPSYNM